MIDPTSVRAVVRMFWDELLDWITEKAVQVDELGRIHPEGDAPAGLAEAGRADSESRGDTGAPAGSVSAPDQVGGDREVDALPQRG